MLLLLAAVPLAAQPGPGAVTEARRLRDRGELDRAVEVLRAHLTGQPRDVDARWLLAQTLYWQGELAEARAEYERALADRPADHLLRLDVARFLAESGWGRRAGEVLAPLAAARPSLPAQVAAEVARLEIEVARNAAPWLRLAPEAWDDDQPLDGRRGVLEAGWVPAAGVRVALAATGAEVVAETAEAEVTELAATIEVRRPGSRFEAELGGGSSNRRGGSSEGVGRLEVGVRLPAGTRLRAEARRWRYLWTVASLEADLMVDTVEASFGRPDHPGWAGEAGARQDLFPDDNDVLSAWAWVLAPVVRRAGGSVRLGYAFQLQDADESRFTSAGTFAPYYTPEELNAHSVVLAIAGTPGGRWRLFLDGAYALAAEETAPRVNAAGTVVFEERDFTPWRARARAEGELSPRLGLELVAEHQRTAFFVTSRASVGVTVRFPR